MRVRERERRERRASQAVRLSRQSAELTQLLATASRGPRGGGRVFMLLLATQCQSKLAHMQEACNNSVSWMQTAACLHYSPLALHSTDASWKKVLIFLQFSKNIFQM